MMQGSSEDTQRHFCVRKMKYVFFGPQKMKKQGFCFVFPQPQWTKTLMKEGQPLIGFKHNGIL